MKKGYYRRSFFWMLAFFGLPVASFVFMWLEVSEWGEPRWGPAAFTEEEFAPLYQKTNMILAAVAVIPYLGLMLRLWERIRLTDKAIRRRGLFRNWKVVWDDVIECNDFLNHIQLLTTRRSKVYIDYYATFSRHGQLRRLMTRKCRDVESNMMVGRHRGHVTPCDLGLVPALVFTAASAVVLVLFRQRIALLGFLSGMVLTLVSAWVWITTRRHLRRWKSGGYIYLTLFAFSLILPPAYFAQEVRRQGLMAFGLFGAFYLVGLLAGSGVTSALLPSRKRR